MRPPRVVVCGLGGTISMAGTATGGGVLPTLSATELVDAVPAIGAMGVEIEAVSLVSRPGAALTIDDLVAASGQVKGFFDDGATGVVVTQGTDTIEETAYLLDLLHHRPEPIVVTGAMRNPTLAGADGPANLHAAVVVAAEPTVRGLGSLVVFADEVHAAARVRKAHSTSTGTFVSPNGGPLGYVVEGVTRIVNHPTHRHTVGGELRTRPRVVVLPAALGDDGAVLSLLEGRVDGLVVAGFGAGHVPETWIEPLTRLAAIVPVVLSSRTGAGSTLESTYGFPGSERDLLDRGLIPGGLLDPYKARILLHLTLATGADRVAVAAAFRKASGTKAPGAKAPATNAPGTKEPGTKPHAGTPPAHAS